MRQLKTEINLIINVFALKLTLKIIQKFVRFAMKQLKIANYAQIHQNANKLKNLQS